MSITEFARAVEEEDILRAVLLAKGLGNIDEEYEVSGTWYTPVLHVLSRLSTELYPVVHTLLEAGANPNRPDSFGRSGIHFANTKEMAETLIRYGANVQSIDLEGNTSLHEAHTWDDAETVKFLVGEGARVDEIDGHGYTPLHRSLVRGATDISIALIDSGANVNLRNKQGHTSIELCTLYGHGGDIVLGHIRNKLKSTL